MADPLKLLREYLIENKYIGEIDDLICFGAVGFVRDTPTNFEIWNRRGEFYTLESLLFFAQNKDLIHTTYVREASKFKQADTASKLQVG
jgi:hypothetical protein